MVLKAKAAKVLALMVLTFAAATSAQAFEKPVLIAEQGSFAEALVIASATSVRHAQSLADGIGEMCRARNYEYLRMEGYTAGQWILVDLNDIVVNVFLEPVRELYGLEALWNKAASLASTRTGE